MNNIYKILMGTLLLLLAASCEEEYMAPNEFSDVGWYTNKQNLGDFKVKEGQHMSFMDLSQNFLSHKWEIEEGNNYLTTGFDNGDTLENFIDESKVLENEDLTAHVLFNKIGLNTVRLYNTFSEPVTYRGKTPFEAKKVGDVWVIDTSFVVDVYGSLFPAYQVVKMIDDDLGNLVSEEILLTVTESNYYNIKDSANWETVTLEAGSRIKLIDLTTEDRPNAREWTVYNQDPASVHTDSVAIVYFNRLGSIPMMGALKSQRVQAAGDETPTASANKFIPLKVKVVKSSKPFIPVGDFKEIEGKEEISFVVSGEVVEIENGTDAFVVHVTNSLTGFNEDIPVTEVRTNAKDASKIELVLADTIYGNDVVTIAFDNTKGTLTSVDGRLLESFAATTVEMAMKGENILLDAEGEVLRWTGYEEDANTTAKNGYMKADEGTGAWWANNPAFYRSEEKAFSGMASLKFEGDATAVNELWRMDPDMLTTLNKGTYIISQMIYVKSGADIKVVSNILEAKTSAWANAMVIDWDVSEATVPRDKWVMLETTATLSTSSSDASVSRMRWKYTVNPTLNPGIASSQDFYLDDLEFIPVESRP